MNTRPVSSQRELQPLQFTDSASCKQWLATLPLTNIPQAQQILAAQLASLNAEALAPLERLKVLEALREPLAFVQGEAVKKYAGKPLPLDPAERTAWDKSVALWQEAARGYQLCLKAFREANLAVAPHGALICLRCLRITGQVMLDHYRTYRQVGPALWKTLHELYALAEQHGFARIRVSDVFERHDPDTSCAEAYVQALLMQLANPFAFSVRQMEFVNRWLEKWANLVSLCAQPLPTSAITPVAVDLAGSTGTLFAAALEPQPNLRYLDLEQLARALRQTINLLKQGQTPAQLGLGDEARQPGCESLLMLLYVQWCRAGTGRGEERLGSEERAMVCFGIHAVHYHVTGKAFRQPGTSLTAREENDMRTFGHITSRTERMLISHESGTLESWAILNQSASGFLCMLRQPEAQARIAHNQLLGVRRAASRLFYLGLVQWLRLEESGEINVGVRLFPGVPQAIAVRPANFNPAGGGSRYERALLLPEVPAPATPATVVLPTGWFQAGRFVEVHTERRQVAKLVALLEKGRDFDRATITIV